MLRVFDFLVRAVFRTKFETSVLFTPQPPVELRKFTRFSIGSATTLGHTIIVQQPEAWDAKHLTHELKHVEQYERYGAIGFLVRYAWYARLGHDNNPLEIEAMKAAGEI